MKPQFRRIAPLALLLMLATLGAQAQSYLLMAVSGDVQQYQAGSWRKASTGARLGPADRLKVGERSYAALVLNNQKTFELKRVGEYTLGSLTAGQGTSSSVTSKYVDYMASRSTSSKLGNNMSNLGAVERSMAPTPLSPRNANLAEEVAKFRWRKQSGARSYIFELKDIDGNTILNRRVDDTTLVVDLARFRMRPTDCYYWRVANAKLPGMRSDEMCFRMLTPEKRLEATKAVSELKAETCVEESALCNIMMANYYQDQDMNDKALDAYERALVLAPDVKEYRLMFAEFLAKVGLNSYAKEVMART
jgi:tetratricopeptide (TPR) repeat protein